MVSMALVCLQPPRLLSPTHADIDNGVVLAFGYKHDLIVSTGSSVGEEMGLSLFHLLCPTCI